MRRVPQSSTTPFRKLRLSSLSSDTRCATGTGRPILAVVGIPCSAVTTKAAEGNPIQVPALSALGFP